MALKKCKECGHKVSTKAESCPECGAKRESNNIGCGKAFLILFVIAIVGSGIIGSIVSKQNEEAFENSMDSHYSEMVKLEDEKQYDGALKKAELFKKFGKTDYKDVSQYYTTLKTQSLSGIVKKLPASDIAGNLKTYKELLALNPGSQRYKTKVEHYQDKWKQKQTEKRESDYRASCKLELRSSSWSIGHGYAIYEGQVKNISGAKLENVQAVVSWSDGSGNMITSSSAMIEYNPILPGQSSPFKVMKTYNPAMSGASVEFSELMGGTIKTYREK